MVTHYDRGERDCPNCGNLCHESQLVVVDWHKYMVCARCAKKKSNVESSEVKSKK